MRVVPHGCYKLVNSCNGPYRAKFNNESVKRARGENNPLYREGKDGSQRSVSENLAQFSSREYKRRVASRRVVRKDGLGFVHTRISRCVFFRPYRAERHTAVFY